MQRLMVWATVMGAATGDIRFQVIAYNAGVFALMQRHGLTWELDE